MKNSDLARAFAEGATKGKADNMFIDGDTIYSYGYHFPIAKRISKKVVWLNTSKYSVTTSRHQKLVWNWLGQFFPVPRSVGKTTKEMLAG